MMAETGKPTREERRQAVRHDGEAMRLFVERHSGEIGLRTIEVYTAFFTNGNTARKGARRLGIEQKTFENLLYRLRLCARGECGLVEHTWHRQVPR